VALLSLAASTIALATRPREVYRAFWLMLGLWGILDGCIAWPSLLQEPMTLADVRVVLGINLLLQGIYLPTGIIMATRAKPLVKGFGFGILASAISLGIIDATFYLRASTQ
jgi:uncharacterized membrane protein HdeD (DUF308 family)